MTSTYREAPGTVLGARWTTRNGVRFNVAGLLLLAAVKVGWLAFAERLLAYRGRLNHEYEQYLDALRRVHRRVVAG